MDLDPGERGGGQTKRRLTSRMTRTGFFFIMPALVSNIIFDWIPMVDGVVRSFFTWTTRHPEPVYVGLENFRRVLTDPEFHSSIGNMMFFLVAYLVLMFPTI